MFFSSDVKNVLTCNFFIRPMLIPCSAVQLTKKHGHFDKPFCWPRIKETLFFNTSKYYTSDFVQKLSNRKVTLYCRIFGTGFFEKFTSYLTVANNWRKIVENIIFYSFFVRLTALRITIEYHLHPLFQGGGLMGATITAEI